MPQKKLHPILVNSLPALPAVAGDLLYNTKAERLKVQKIVDALEKQEKDLKEFLINNLPKGSASGITGKVAHVEISTKPIPTVEDWDKFYTYIARTKSWELMQRRVSDSAVKERWDAGKQVPGVGKFTAVVVSCTKR